MLHRSLSPGGRWLGRTWGVACILVGALASVASCSLSTNVDRFTDGTCPAGTKACNARCVSDTEPSVGCRVTGCSPCDFPNATSTCSESGTCAIGRCVGDYANCNGMASDGCEADLKHDAANCGNCGCVCGTGDATRCAPNQQVGPIVNGTPGCSAGRCNVGSCDPGWGDCNGVLADGCETPTNSNQDCGTCGTACSPPRACHCALEDGNTGCSCESPDGAPD